LYTYSRISTLTFSSLSSASLVCFLISCSRSSLYLTLWSYTLRVIGASSRILALASMTLLWRQVPYFFCPVVLGLGSSKFGFSIPKNILSIVCSCNKPSFQLKFLACVFSMFGSSLTRFLTTNFL